MVKFKKEYVRSFSISPFTTGLGPIKDNSRCYELIKTMKFKECFSHCSLCEHIDECSTLIREQVVFMSRN